jgi:hypothetical protein
VTDELLLKRLDHKLQLVRDRIQGVAEGYATGMYLRGEGGTSKSYTTEETLKKLGRPFVLSNSRLTGKGLFDLLRDFPDVVHVLEDVETLFADKNSFGVLRSALWGQADADGVQERLIVWQTARGREEVIFSGGIILIANCTLDNLPQLRALKTRIPCVHFQPSNEEVAALMRRIAGQGHRHGPYRLTPEECQEVAEEVLLRSQRLQRNLDLRLLVNTFQDRLQWANGSAELHWREMLDSRMKERAVPPRGDSPSRAERKDRELAVVRRIAHLPPQERLVVWKKETGKSQAALYRRLEELRRASSHFSQNRWAGEN